MPVIFISHNSVKTLQLAETEIKNASRAADRVRLLINTSLKKKKNYFGMRDSHVTLVKETAIASQFAICAS